MLWLVLRRWLLDGGFPCDLCMKYVEGFASTSDAGARQDFAQLVIVHVKAAHGRRGMRRLGHFIERPAA